MKYCCIIGTQYILCFILYFFLIYHQFLCVLLTPLSQHRCAWHSIGGDLRAFLKEKVEAKEKGEFISYTKNPFLQGWTFYRQEKGIHGDVGRLKELYTEQVYTGRRHFLSSVSVSSKHSTEEGQMIFPLLSEAGISALTSLHMWKGLWWPESGFMGSDFLLGPGP